jgi:hypothetical protein
MTATGRITDNTGANPFFYISYVTHAFSDELRVCTSLAETDKQNRMAFENMDEDSAGHHHTGNEHNATGFQVRQKKLASGWICAYRQEHV